MKSINSYNKDPLRKEKPIIDLYGVNPTIIYSYITIFLVLMILVLGVLFAINNYPPNII
ncbi:MAG: hypothetical protein LBT66_01480 [Methanobrevibacter sp.]|jgi:hypothetical protein|nr:hypothetical protein [Candidatus Methanovirga meridionalis]